MKLYLRLLLVCITMCLSFQLWSQSNRTAALDSPAAISSPGISITATAATQAFAIQDLDKLNLKDLGKITLGEFSVTYQVNNRFSFGLGNIGNLGNCLAGYFDAEGQFVSLHEDEEDEDDEADEDEDDGEEDDDDDECDNDFLDNLMGIMNFTPFPNFPMFLQVAGGYSFGNKAPAYSTMVAYRQKLVNNLGITAGVRYSDVLYNLPAEAVHQNPSNGLRLEIGLNLAW